MDFQAEATSYNINREFKFEVQLKINGSMWEDAIASELFLKFNLPQVT